MVSLIFSNITPIVNELNPSDTISYGEASEPRAENPDSLVEGFALPMRSSADLGLEVNTHLLATMHFA